MQAETISALVASGAAVLGVPAALVVGLRQARAARHAAELAAASSREQWRNSTRREAAVSFVLEADRSLEEARRLSNSFDVLDLDAVTEVRRALWRAMAVVRIEGPKPLSEVAAVAYGTVNDVLGRHLTYHAQARPELLLRAAAAEGVELAEKVQQRLRIPPARKDLLEHPLWAELRASGLLPKKERLRLEWFLHSPGAWPERPNRNEFKAVYDQARQEIDAFIGAVHAHFEGQPAE
ncbi:hypothetical protein [Streptomyces sp. NPDC006132]|uniref:hypothetical protein n=1 Tax=Streptomyces sp. NPDC006132 TaxID=3156732 RepID=UPI0033CF63B7